LENNITNWKDIKKFELSGIGKIYLFIPVFVVLMFSLVMAMSDLWGGIFIGSFVGIVTFISIISFMYKGPNKYYIELDMLYIKYPSGKLLKISKDQIRKIWIYYDNMYDADIYRINYYPTPKSKFDQFLYIDSDSGQQIEEWYNKSRTNTPEPSMRGQ
jgi:hypothetical protein